MRNVKRHLVICTAFIVCWLSMAAAQEATWTLHASSPLSKHQPGTLEEIFVDEQGSGTEGDTEDRIQWGWWPWSETTGSNWPDDDAIYRSGALGLNLSDSTSPPTSVNHTIPQQPMVLIDGHVRVVSGSSGVRSLLFDVSITPQENLTNNTLLYVVLTENKAIDQHERTMHHLVRDMRPEVGFSHGQDNTTHTVFELPEDHLVAAGVDLEAYPRGWSYSLVMFGGIEGSNNSQSILAFSHGTVPSSDMDVSSSDTLMAAIGMVIAVILVTTLFANLRTREKSMPRITATWASDSSTKLLVRMEAGAVPFRTVNWSVTSPWKFKGQPAKPTLQAFEVKELYLRFVHEGEEDCRFEVSLDLEEFGIWRQHLWVAKHTPIAIDGSVEVNGPDDEE